MLYTQEHNTINNRGIWHYLITENIGYIHVVEYENRYGELIRFIIDGDNEKAEKKFASICKGIINGKL